MNALRRPLRLWCAFTLAIGASSAVAEPPRAPHPPVAAKQSCVVNRCHPALARQLGEASSVHEPVGSGECGACHDLDGGGGPAFVRRTEAKGRQAWDAALCAHCHPEILLAERGAATRFADGGRNLHSLHVRAAQGRACLSCHDAHAASQPRLLRAEIPARGTHRIRQVFRAEERGGRCETGCHAPKRYAR